jgi:hypothetical protein
MDSIHQRASARNTHRQNGHDGHERSAPGPIANARAVRAPAWQQQQTHTRLGASVWRQIKRELDILAQKETTPCK